ncbi:sel1 repeat family protein [Arsenicitalea aurantiaca]|uniref:Sel1 repeat family protein n=1 Tax=Arsenicitalea aurantiaca TaxID=1783274 RepID=A0A433XBG5_9HYPH|nr:tetratricopeptide repeat protein [Arsenicitalea aurantiaca]RUT31402.1 sel1 repeat family protein [Arsenicitalea aurantiaca]
MKAGTAIMALCALGLMSGAATAESAVVPPPHPLAEGLSQDALARLYCAQALFERAISLPDDVPDTRRERGDLLARQAQLLAEGQEGLRTDGATIGVRYALSAHYREVLRAGLVPDHESLTPLVAACLAQFPDPGLPAGATPPPAPVQTPAPSFTEAALPDPLTGYLAWVDRDWPSANAVWAPRAQWGDHEASFQLAEAFLEGLGVPPDRATGLDHLRDAARRGHKEAQYRLAEELAADDPEGLYREEAVAWLAEAAASSHAPARYRLGLAAHNGVGMPADPEAARHWLGLAAEQGYRFAEEALDLLDYGVPVTVAARRARFEEARALMARPDRGPAARILQTLAETGHVEAQYELGGLNFTGNGVPRDLEAAERWLGAALKQGDLRGRYPLVLIALDRAGLKPL